MQGIKGTYAINKKYLYLPYEILNPPPLPRILQHGSSLTESRAQRLPM
jgi:hypothetical protein